MEKALNVTQSKVLATEFTFKRTKRIRVRKLDKARMSMRILVLALLIITVLTFVFMDFRGMQFSEALPQFTNNLQTIFLQPRLSYRVEWNSIILGREGIFLTVGLAVISTIAGAIISFFLALFAAKNLSPKPVTTVIRSLMSLTRAIPAIVWVLIFSVSIGMGAEAAIVGLVFQGMAFLVKAYSETIEEIDAGVIEALKASGATWWQIVFQAVLPSCLTAILSWTFIRVESNFAHAVAVGAAAGVGGIGVQLVQSGSMNFDMREVGVIVYILIAVSIVFELISIRLRSRLSSNQ